MPVTPETRVTPNLADLTIEELLALLADHVADRVVERLGIPERRTDDWLDTRRAAAHVGVHPDTLRKLASARVIPSEQDAPGCRRFFRRRDLDEWRLRGGGGASMRLPHSGNAP